MIRQAICALFLFLSFDLLASENLLYLHIRKGNSPNKIKGNQIELVRIDSDNIPDIVESKIGTKIDCFCDFNGNLSLDPEGLEIPFTKRKKCTGKIIGIDVIGPSQNGIFDRHLCSEGKTWQKNPISCQE